MILGTRLGFLGTGFLFAVQKNGGGRVAEWTSFELSVLLRGVVDNAQLALFLAVSRPILSASATTSPRGSPIALVCRGPIDSAMGE